MKLKPFVPAPSNGSALKDMADGLRYTLNHPSVRMLITNLFVITVLGLGLATLIPAWAVVVLHGNATTNGFLQAARGFGSLIGALIIAALGRFRFRVRWHQPCQGLPRKAASAASRVQRRSA